MSFGSNMNGFYDSGPQLSDYLKRKAREVIAQHNEVKAGITTIEQFEKRRTKLKQYFMDMIGGLPAEKSPLNVSYHGDIIRDGYLIRKVIFESSAGMYVTSNLYIPDGLKEPAPAVLFTCGHTESAKAAPKYQRVCIELCLNGMIVLAMDPISQGERIQSYDRQLGHPIVRWHAEHTYLGLQCELLGRHIIRYFLWDIIRAIDYLWDLPEVDRSRIGVTGNSGGGIQTIFAMLADDRISAAAPCTYITSREAYMMTGQSQDGEQILDGAIAAGMDYDDYITSFAPKPVLIGAVESDFFCLEGTLESYERAKKIYELFNCGDEIKLGLAKGQHSFNDELRRIVVRWFVAQFWGSEQEVILQTDIDTEKAETLNCTEAGQVLEQFPDAITVWEDNAKALEPARNRLRHMVSEPARIKAEIVQWLKMPAGRNPIYPRTIRTDYPDSEGKLFDSPIRREYIFFFTEPEIATGGIYIEREGAKSEKSVLWVHDEGVNRIFKENHALEQLLQHSNIFAFDPRGNGNNRSREVNGRPFYEMFGTEYKLGCDARMLSTPLAGLRVFDLIRALDYLQQESPGVQLAIAGTGISAIYTLLAGVVDDRVKEITLINLPPSFKNIVETRFYRYDVRMHWYGVLKHFDLPEIVEAFRYSKNIRLINTPDVGDIIRW